MVLPSTHRVGAWSNICARLSKEPGTKNLFTGGGRYPNASDIPNYCEDGLHHALCLIRCVHACDRDTKMRVSVSHINNMRSGG